MSSIDWINEKHLVKSKYHPGDEELKYDLEVLEYARLLHTIDPRYILLYNKRGRVFHTIVNKRGYGTKHVKLPFIPKSTNNDNDLTSILAVVFGVVMVLYCCR